VSKTYSLRFALVFLSGVALQSQSAFAGCDLPVFGGARLFAAGFTPSYMATGDFNGDGNIDVVVTSQSNNTVTVMLSKGDGTFQFTNYTLPSPKNITAADMNRDGKLDLVINSGSGTVVMPGNGDGTFQTAVMYAALPGLNSVVMGDFDGDGNMDLAAASTGSTGALATAEGFTTVILGNGDGTFRNALNYGAGADATALAAGDLNGDGKPDLVFADNLANGLVVLLNHSVPGNNGSTCAPVPAVGN
jgi:hypothetical protein